jgi:hypothetical protein
MGSVALDVHRDFCEVAIAEAGVVRGITGASPFDVLLSWHCERARASRSIRPLGLSATTTSAVHHRSITATAFGGAWRNRRSGRYRMVERKTATGRAVRRRIRLMAC